jgi:hypothetical protein
MWVRPRIQSQLCDGCIAVFRKCNQLRGPDHGHVGSLACARCAVGTRTSTFVTTQYILRHGIVKQRLLVINGNFINFSRQTVIARWIIYRLMMFNSNSKRINWLVVASVNILIMCHIIIIITYFEIIVGIHVVFYIQVTCVNTIQHIAFSVLFGLTSPLSPLMCTYYLILYPLNIKTILLPAHSARKTNDSVTPYWNTHINNIVSIDYYEYYGQQLTNSCKNPY